MKKITVAKYVALFLASKKIHHVFGYQGGAVIKIIDEIIELKKTEYVQNYHEQASAFAADAYSRVSKNIGVALATSGPGATNLITGIANAQFDSIPTLFITGQENLNRISKNKWVRVNGFQDLDIVKVVKPITKYATIIKNPNKIVYELEKAFTIATSGRPGAVLIDIPIDIQFKLIDPKVINSQTSKNIPRINLNIINQFIAAISVSKRPVILAGGGITLAKANKEFEKFVSLTKIPVVSTLNGLDAYSGSYGFSGLYGNPCANLAIKFSDTLIVIGSRLGQHQVGKSVLDYTDAKIIHIDIDRHELGRAIPENLSIEAEIKIFLEQVNHKLISSKINKHHQWHKKIKDWLKLRLVTDDIKLKGISPIVLIKEVQNILNGSVVFSIDVGQHQMWFAQAYQVKKNQRVLNSSGLGSMGYAIPAAIAAKILKPRVTVIAFVGDGGFQINLQELQLIKNRNLDIKIFVFNNGTLGLIKSTQDTYYNGKHHGSGYPDFSCVNLNKIAKVYDLDYYKISNLKELKILKEILSIKKAAIIEVIVDSNYPLHLRSELFSKIKNNEFTV